MRFYATVTETTVWDVEVDAADVDEFTFIVQEESDIDELDAVMVSRVLEFSHVTEAIEVGR